MFGNFFGGGKFSIKEIGLQTDKHKSETNTHTLKKKRYIFLKDKHISKTNRHTQLKIEVVRL